ncbi:carbohydrate kinase family protein [Patescibacteria group bacterium]|nr:carbohydrate kinase family protein [Patescibacteria group bacterium]
MSNKDNTILVSGSIAYDYVMSFPDYFKNHILADKIHKLNVSFSINKLNLSFGGTSANICYNLSLLQESPFLLAHIGKDSEKYKKHLNFINISSDYMLVDKAAYTASAYIMTDKKDNQITAFYPGPLTKNLNNKLKKIKEVDVAIISAELKERMLAYASYYKNSNIEYIFDPGQQVISFNKSEMKKMIKGANIVIGNDYEIEIIKKRLQINLAELKKQVQTLIITKGEKGSVIYNNNEIYKIKAVKAKKLTDPTGAGDAYRAGLVKGIILDKEKIDWQRAGNLASLVASYVVAHLGTQVHKFSWTEIKKRYKVEFKDSLL